MGEGNRLINREYPNEKEGEEGKLSLKMEVFRVPGGGRGFKGTQETMQGEGKGRKKKTLKVSMGGGKGAIAQKPRGKKEYKLKKKSQEWQGESQVVTAVARV